jgi:hypothetical protein
VGSRQPSMESTGGMKAVTSTDSLGS